MQATCAICESVIVSQQTCVVVGHEVVHRTCAKSGNKTRHQQLVQRVADLKAEVAGTKRRLDELARATLRDLKELGMTRAALRAEREAKEFLDAQLADAETQRRQAMAECVRLRAELAAERDKQSVTEAPAESEPEHDDTAERFRLLELD